MQKWFPLVIDSTAVSKTPLKSNKFRYGFVANVPERGGFSAEVFWHPDHRVNATSPSVLRDNQSLRNNCVTVQWRRAGTRRPFSGLRSPAPKSPPIGRSLKDPPGKKLGHGERKILVNLCASLQAKNQNYRYHTLRFGRKNLSWAGKNQAGSRAYLKHAHAFMRTLAKPGKAWRTLDATFMRTSLTFKRVPAKVPTFTKSSGEGAFCVWVAFRMCPRKAELNTVPIPGNLELGITVRRLMSPNSREFSTYLTLLVT